MIKDKANKRHQLFKRELRAYHDSINRKNRYNLPKISGKLDIFENLREVDDSDVDKKEVEYDRKIPNTPFVVLKKGDLYAIADREKNPLTEFKYKFIEGCLGDIDKIIRCITDDGEIEDFDVEQERILECSDAAVGIGTAGFGVVGGDSTPNGDSYHEIDYSDVRKDLELPYLCCYRIKDLSKRRKKRTRKNRRR